MRERVSNKKSANETAEKNERKMPGNRSLRVAANGIAKAEKKHLFKRMKERSYSFVQT